jgi:hypothetical protein
MRNRLVVCCALLVLCAPPALAETPTAQIQQTVEQVLKVVANTSTGEAERREMLHATLITRFDWYEMANSPWASNGQERRGEKTNLSRRWRRFSAMPTSTGSNLIGTREFFLFKKSWTMSEPK